VENRLLWLPILCTICSLVVLVGCSSDPTNGDANESVLDNESAEEPVVSTTPIPESTEIPETEVDAPVQVAEEDPPEESPWVPSFRFPEEWVTAEGLGEGILLPLGAAPLPEGYVEEEYLVAGEAISYISEGPLTSDGFWKFTEGNLASYKTRMILRYPPAEQFSGIVIVEWFNVTAGVDNSIDWAYLSEEIGREGHAYIGVSAQLVGVMGRDSGRIPSGLIDTRGLPTRDPIRYGDLAHPGDAYSFDIFSQGALAGVVILASPDYGMPAEKIIGAGQSQSAAFLTSYLNAVHPIVDVFDGFLIHGRGDGAPNPMMQEDGAANVLIRTDLNAPTLIYETETDLTVLEYAKARQEDSDTIRTWEVAGTAHADTYGLAYPNQLPRQASLGSILGCPGLINDGPQHETLQAALHQLVTWVTNGVAPTTAPRIEVTEDDELEIIRDEMGIAVGGIRTPPVIAPLRILFGDPAVSDGFCFLFGQTLDIDQVTLLSMYESLDGYVTDLEAAAIRSVENGWLLQVDADIMIEEETRRALALGLE
jgi:hypothetical protein